MDADTPSLAVNAVEIEMEVFPSTGTEAVESKLNGREVTDEPSCWLMTIIRAVYSLVQQLWQGLCALFSKENKEDIKNDAVITEITDPNAGVAGAVDLAAQNVLAGQGAANPPANLDNAEQNAGNAQGSSEDASEVAQPNPGHPEPVVEDAQTVQPIPQDTIEQERAAAIVEEKLAAVKAQILSSEAEIVAQQALIEASKGELTKLEKSNVEETQQLQKMMAAKNRYQEALAAYQTLPSTDKVAAFFNNKMPAVMKWKWVQAIPDVQKAEQKEMAAKEAREELVASIEELRIFFEASVSVPKANDQSGNDPELPVVNLVDVNSSIDKLASNIVERTPQIANLSKKMVDDSAALVIKEKDLASLKVHKAEVEAEKAAIQVQKPVVVEVQQPEVVPPANPPVGAVVLPLVDEAVSTPTGVPAVEIAPQAIAVEEPVKVKTIQQKMLEDLEAYTHPEIAEMWKMAFDKFTAARGKDAVTSWTFNKTDKTFKVVLAEPFTMWVYDPEYQGNGGVEMSFGTNTNGVIEGVLVKGNLDPAHEKVVKEMCDDDKYRSQVTKRTAAAGMIFKKNNKGKSGVETFCFHAPVWPDAQVEHFLRIGDAEDKKMNLVISATFYKFGFGGTQGRPKSIEFLKNAWKDQGRILPKGFDRKKYIEEKAKGKSHEQIVFAK